MKSLEVPAITVEGCTPMTVWTKQLCVYSDTELLFPTHQRVRAPGSIHTYYTISLLLYDISTDAITLV